MPTPAYGSLTFAEQIAFFRRKVHLPTQHWTDLWQSAHDRAFVVAGAMQADLLADLHTAALKGIEQGTTLETFRQDFEAIVARRGWTGWTGEDTAGGRAWRARVIYETNLRSSYAAGRWAQIQQVKSERPYLLYRHNDNVLHPRPLHQAWDGKVIAADNPWWQTHYPPNGWGCQCTAFAVDEEYLRRQGKAGPDPAPDDGTYDWVNPKTGQPVTGIPNGIDPGWAYTPGASLDLADFVEGKVATLPGALGKALSAAVASPPRLSTQIRASTSNYEKYTLAADFIDDHRTKKPKAIKAHGMTQAEDMVSVSWEGITYWFKKGDASETYLAELIVAMSEQQLPRRLTSSTKRVIFSDQPNENDAYWAKRYNDPNFWSLATGGDGTVVIYRKQPIDIGPLAHEMGHNLATSKYGSTSPSLGSDYANAMASVEPQPTDYAKNSPSEDFAESIRLYFTEQQRLKASAPRRYTVIKKIIEKPGYDG